MNLDVDTSSEAWRAECEARYVARLPTPERRREYLADVRKLRGEQAFLALRQRAKAIYESAREGTTEEHCNA